MLRIFGGVSRVSTTACIALTVLVLMEPPARAQFWEQLFGSEPSRPRKAVVPKKHVPSPQRVAAVEPQSKPAAFPLMAIVSVASQRVAIYDSTGPVIHSRVSTGQAGHRTPFGIFKVIQKERYHESNIYSGAPMPFMQRITWSGIAMHAGHVPGYPASHGCIRLPAELAANLFSMTKVGMLVVISPSDIAATPFSHAALPVPLMLSDVRTSAVSDTDQFTPRGVQQVALGTSRSELGGTETTIAPDVATANVTNPHQRALEALPLARKAAAEAIKTAKILLEASQMASAEAIKAVTDLRAAEADLALASRKLSAARNAVTVATPEESRAPAAKAIAEAEAQLVEITRRLDEAKALESAKTDQAFTAADAWRAANARIDATEQATKAAVRSIEPLSVFISRKEGRLFVRQGFRPLFDVPVIIKGSSPLGTHVLIAVAADEKSGQLSWQSISVPNSANATLERATSGIGPPAPQPIFENATAAQALDRVEIDQDTLRKLNERVWLGGSIIVSEHGLGNETGIETDFIVQTR